MKYRDTHKGEDLNDDLKLGLMFFNKGINDGNNCATPEGQK